MPAPSACVATPTATAASHPVTPCVLSGDPFWDPFSLNAHAIVQSRRLRPIATDRLLREMLSAFSGDLSWVLGLTNVNAAGLQRLGLSQGYPKSGSFRSKGSQWKK